MQPIRNIPARMEDAPDIDVVLAFDIKQQVRIELQVPAP
jgi:hypothetical protein